MLTHTFTHIRTNTLSHTFLGGGMIQENPDETHIDRREQHVKLYTVILTIKQSSSSVRHLPKYSISTIKNFVFRITLD